MPLTLLFLSGGGHTGTNVMLSLAPRRAAVRAIATTDVPHEPSLFAFDAVYLAPKVGADPAGFERRLQEIVAREKPDLVVPCRDEDVAWLAAFGERHPELAPRLLCGASRIATMANDKWLSHEFAKEHHLPFVPSLPTADNADDAHRAEAFVAAHGLPLVLKPRVGADSRGVSILTTLPQVLRAMRREGHVLQAFLGDPASIDAWLRAIAEDGIPLFHTFEGPRRSLQFLIAPSGSIEPVLCTTNVPSARNARAITVHDEPAAQAIGARCGEVFAAQGWRGPVNVQCLPDRHGTLAIHEFNVRVTGATGARWHLGLDEIGTAVRAFTGQSLEPCFPWHEAPRVAAEGLWPRTADPRSVRVLAERGEWTRP